MLQDKDMANDALESTKVSASELTRAASECSNQQLKQAFTQMRNQSELAQEEIAQVAMQKGWYMPASQADPQDISQVKSFVQMGQAPNVQQQMQQTQNMTRTQM